MRDEIVMIMPDLTESGEHVCLSCAAECDTCALKSPENYAKYKAQQEQGK